MTFWDRPDWHRYEALCGDAPGTRARLLASADWMTRVVDLSLSEAELWQDVRKSYHSLIHRAEREYRIHEWQGPDAWLIAKVIHGMEAGRETRPRETWLTMQAWAEAGSGCFIGADIPDEPISAKAYVYVVTHGTWSYYFSSASLRKNLNHALLWHAMKALKTRGVRWFEIGWLDREGDGEKDKGIVTFKKGWPGQDIPAKEAPALCGSI